MAVTQHKTSSVFKRYDIRSEDQVREAADKLASYYAEKAGNPKKRKVKAIS